MKPHITATLYAPEEELDLSGQKSLNVKVSLTLYAQKLILLYMLEIILSPPMESRQRGIEFLSEQQV